MEMAPHETQIEIYKAHRQSYTYTHKLKPTFNNGNDNIINFNPLRVLFCNSSGTVAAVSMCVCVMLPNETNSVIALACMLYTDPEPTNPSEAGATNRIVYPFALWKVHGEQCNLKFRLKCGGMVELSLLE